MATALDKIVRGLNAQPVARWRPLRAAASAVIAFIALSPPALCLLNCVRSGVEQDNQAFASFVVFWIILVSLFGLALNRLDRLMDMADQQHTLESALEDTLRAAGFDPDSDHPGALALREAFWANAQRAALRDLRVRLTYHRPSEDLIDAMARAARSGKALVPIVGSTWSALTGITLVIIAIEDPSADSMLSCLLVSALLFAAGISYVLAAAGLSSFIKERSEQRELERETRRVSDIMKAAGGLSLAEDEVRHLLVGAISQPTQLGGELEMAPANPPREEVP